MQNFKKKKKKKKKIPKICNIFKQKKISHLPERTDPLHEENMSYNYLQNKKFLIITKKTNF